ncbi:MAG: 2-hydroxyacyl-CoA dehydratase [Chloroflexi bacterium]|nr:2-hydroxyacyl-CoA dehydratase [Chloroflexota bacterium]
MFERFRDVVENRHQYAEDWKARTGRPVIGYLCTYVPEEIIHAAGILPVRILGGHESSSLADVYISGQFCVLCRDCLAEGLRGKYDYLNGIAHAMSCLHMRQTFNSWQLHFPISYSHFIFMPREVKRRYAKPLLTDEFRLFKRSLEKWTGKEISQDALDRSIEIYDTNRRLMRQIYEFRKQDPPLLSGAEAMEMVLSSQFMDKEEHNHLLAEVLKQLPERKDGPEPGVRLMMVGGENDRLDFVRMVESLGANIVIDENCAGSRYFWNEIVPEEDRLSAIAARYLDRPVCPAKDNSERFRGEHVLQMAKDYKIQGAIITIIKWCEPHGFDNVALRDMFKADNIPTYSFEFDVTVPLGPYRIRAEAFLEQIRAEELFV